MKKVENGELVYVDLGQHQGKCVQSGIRPCLVVGSYYASDALNVLPLTKHITLIRKVYTLFINHNVIQNNISDNIKLTES